MILTLVLIFFLSICNADVSHLDTDFREDGYHYNQPKRPFPVDRNGLDNQFDTNVLQQDLNSSKPPKHKASKPPKPTSEYLPPRDLQTKMSPSAYPQTQTQSTYSSNYNPLPKELNNPSEPQQLSKTSFTPQTLQPSATPKSTYTPNQQTLPQQANAPSSLNPRVPTNEYVPLSTTTVSLPSPQTAEQPLSVPEREYLPPAAANQIDLASKPDQSYGTSQSSLPASQPTYSAPHETDQTTYRDSQSSFPATQTTHQTPESVYTGATSPETNLSYLTPQTTSSDMPSQPPYTKLKAETPYTDPQTTNSVLNPILTSESKPQEPKVAHELGPDGYKYKIPSKSFKY